MFQLQVKAEIDETLDDLRQPGINYVAGIGNSIRPKAMLVGEAPGPMENAKGIPFSGPTGKILRSLLVQNKFKPDDLWITNAVKYMPVEPGTQNFRKPSTDEVRLMVPYLAQEIAIVCPNIICLMGNSAIESFFTDGSVRKLRGKIIAYEVSEDFPPFSLFVTYHPSAIQYKPELRPLLEEDFKTLASLIK